jgi:Protein of unknown function (DUF2528)
MKRTFKLEAGEDIYITLEIDTEKMTEPLASEINAFWSGSAEVLSASDGCVIQAVARRAAGPLISFLMDGYHAAGAVRHLSQMEGWPTENIGITIVDHEIPDLDADMYDVQEITAVGR